ncbi:laminin subunit beta-3 [Trachemys scripta elegans]|uniref:laminin subunit beta-3 n=1 Tax=Trachemys scripta elegans TaxID=31138 RepID=UPI0015526A73|nr:laminin subunit beta-3 [Trachemys scripta elegans]XP_034626451.1 laminin subunit beta-3 [Trachemys scripta elegans]XP_034626452.1 laminin subunit beta-3 [Trachemys scripta elegans]XP_034626453.1 laminin subunit beta-3 [Trachemys scripta elegans]XP_034626455.1 laminin subunit beta-3 [Trachemys scripta elegans]
MESPPRPMVWTCFILLALPLLLDAQGSCSHGACYPPAGDLLIGRIHHLKASSTCGLVKPETYCTSYEEWRMKCCRCDSREARTHNSHRVENVLSSKGHMRWWQSQNDVNQVSLQLDLDKKFQLSSIMLDFRAPLPVGMLIERSINFGETWTIYQYLASDCAAAFPRIPLGSPQSWQDVRCQELRTHQGHPLHGGKVKFNPLDLASGIAASRSQSIRNLGEFTNLRVNFTQLPRLPQQGYRSPSAFYAVTEMQVQGSCFCHGHADRCTSSRAPPTDPSAMMQVHGHCVCQHNTAGPHCDRCAAFYNDQPWRPAEDRNPNECRRCNCNGHSETCHFDPAVYQASGGVSGGVCDDCQHNTVGRNCERCKAYFFRNHRQDVTHPEACLPCECDPDGTVPGSSCDPLNGRCVCKENVQGDRCHLCKPGFTQLTNANPLGCHKCACNILGTRRDAPCDDETGRCFCLPNVVGANCDQCSANHWKIASGQGCQPCNCDPRNAFSPQCNQFTGQCQCREGFAGRTCSAAHLRVCPDGSYGDVRTGCRECDCNFQGTEGMGCDKTTGSCLCRPGFTGPRCDQCQRGYCSNYPHCEMCHSCFQTYDSDIRRFGLRQASLRNSTSRLQLGTGGAGFSTRILEAEGSVQQIQGILGNPLVTKQGLGQVSSMLTAIRQQVQGINPNLPFVTDTFSLANDLEELDKSLLSINGQYQIKKTQFEASRRTDLSGAFKTVSSAYQSSTNASYRITGTSSLLTRSRENRRTTERLESSFTDHTSRLEALQGEMASSPNLTPTINKICSGVRSKACTPGHCDGELCPQDSTMECGTGLSCRGIIPLSRGAIRTSEKTTRELHGLNTQLQQTMQMIRAAETAANQIQSNARRLGDQVSVTRTQIEGDVRRIQQFIQQVRNFLSDPATDPATIQEVSDYVLSLRLPTDTAAVLRKMTEIRNLAAKLQCPESILTQTAGDIAKAKRLQQEAEQARNRANAVEGNVEEVVENLRQANTVLQEAQDAISGSGYSLQLIQLRIDEIQAVLIPMEKNMRDITDQLDSFTERIRQLRHKAEQNRLQATDAQQRAKEASEEARSAQQGFEQVKQKYAELKRRMGQNSNLGAQGSRIQSIDMEAKALFEETWAMMLRMETIETEIQKSNNALIVKSASLAGLKEQVEKINNHIHERITYYTSC